MTNVVDGCRACTKSLRYTPAKISIAPPKKIRKVELQGVCFRLLFFRESSDTTLSDSPHGLFHRLLCAGSVKLICNLLLDSH